MKSNSNNVSPVATLETPRKTDDKGILAPVNTPNISQKQTQILCVNSLFMKPCPSMIHIEFLAESHMGR